MSLDRRRFLLQSGAALGIAAAGASLGADALDENPALPEPPAPVRHPPARPLAEYHGPNVILVRFGGGVRRQETIADPPRTYCPFIYHELALRHGVLFSNVDMATSPDVITSHGEGTLYILTGQYHRYQDITGQFLSDRFIPAHPTLFEYLRGTYSIPAHQALIINGEDRINEEFFTFSNHHQFGVHYSSTVLSLYRFKCFLLREQLAQGGHSEDERRRLELQLRAMENRDYRVENRRADEVSGPALERFWRSWRGYYGDSGFVNPRGDRLLTSLALRAMQQLQPRLLMINYQDPDYVHWGNPTFYTRAITIIDDGVREIYNMAQQLPQYRDNTIFVVIPDCGRDNNRAMAVPFQHHFGTPASHEIFAVIAGPRRLLQQHAGLQRNATRQVQQIGITRTVAGLMGFEAPHADTGGYL